MNKVYQTMSALVVFGILMVAICFWAAVANLDTSRAIVLRTNFSTPVAMPAPAPQQESVLRAKHIANDTIAQNAQPAAMSAPAHSK